MYLIPKKSYNPLKWLKILFFPSQRVFSLNNKSGLLYVKNKDIKAIEILFYEVKPAKGWTIFYRDHNTKVNNLFIYITGGAKFELNKAIHLKEFYNTG